MRIYNKKNFFSGVFCMAIGLLNLTASLATEFTWKDILLIGLLFFFGIGAIRRSLSRNLSQEDKMEELDERNQLVELKSKSQSFQLTQAACFLLMLALLVMGKLSGDTTFISMGVGLAFALSISMFSELFTYFYYEKRC